MRSSRGRPIAQHLMIFPAVVLLRMQDDVAPSSMALDLHVRNWRRFVELPMEHMLAVSPDTARGRFRVGVWLTPEMTGPQAARLVALHAQYHVVVRGFDEEQARTRSVRACAARVCQAAAHPYPVSSE